MTPLRARLLGGLVVDGVPARDLGSRKGRRLLALLALNPGTPVPTDRIVDVVWGDEPPAIPADQVSVLVSRLRSAVGSEHLTRVDAGYVLHLDWLDLLALRELVVDAERRLSGGSWSAARAAAEAALALCRGPLLPEEADATWCEPERAEAVRLTARARLAAARAALAGGDAPVAVDLSAAAMATDPYDEPALCLHMAACAAAGRPAAALSAYAATRALLRDELGASPAPETEKVHAAVLAERIPDGYVVGASRRRSTRARATRLELPGRTQELAALDAALASVAAGCTRVLVVEGESGIGKSRLLADWTSAREATAAVLTASCDELGRAVPLQPLLDALGGYLRRLPGDAGAQLLAEDAGLLSPLLGLPESPRRAPSTADGLAQTAIYAALLGVFHRLTASGPVVLGLDDAHLVDEATAGWIRLLRRRNDVPVLVVATQRAEDASRIDPDQVVVLGPLDRDAAARVVGAERAELVYARSGGHPLFLIELAAATDDQEMPQSLQDAVADRCERAGADVAATVRAAAVLGPDVDLDLLAAVVQRSPVELLDHLEQAARRRLLEERGTAFHFHHALIREALARSTGAARRALLHREAARVLAARPDREPLAVAYHARLGGDRPLAAAALADAADVATSRFDYDEAVRLLDEAIQLADGPALRRQRARALIRATRAAEALVDATVALAAEPTAASYEIASQATYFGPGRDFAAALALADEGARVATDEADRAACLAAASRIALSIGDVGGAAGRLERLDRELAPPAVRSTIAFLTGALAYQRGDYATADQVLAAAQRSITVDHEWPTHVLQFRALALAGRGRPLEALSLLDEQDVVAERLHLHRAAGRADNCRGFVLRGLGALDQADDANGAGLARAAATGHAEPQSHSLLDLADGRLLRGDLDGAAEFLSRAARFRETEHSMRWRHVLRGDLLQARLALADGRPDDAAEAALRVLASAVPRGIVRYELFGRLMLARARLAGDGTASVDRESIAADLARLDELAALEAWRWTHELAVAADVAAWQAWADDRAASLISAAGPFADGLRGVVAATLDRGRAGGG